MGRMKNWAVVTLVAPILWGQSDYKESDPLPGKTILEKLSRVSQLDRLPDTKSDAARCSCAAGVSAFLLLGGRWEGLAAKYGLPTVPTYESVHRLQDRLYRIANADGKPGVFGGCRPLYDAAKRVTGWERKPGDEVHLLFEELGIENWPLYGPTEEKLNDRKAAVQGYFEQYPEGALIVGVNEDTKTSESLPVKPGTFASHYVVVFQRNGSYFRLDSWAQPGENTLHPMNEKQVRELVFETPVTLLATKLKAAPRER
jgi:hypothetical protein